MEAYLRSEVNLSQLEWKLIVAKATIFRDEAWQKLRRCHTISFFFFFCERKRKLLKLEQHFKVRHSVIFNLINVDRNSIRLSFFIFIFLLWSQYLHAADFLNPGPLAIPHWVKALAHLYSITLWTYIYFKDRKMRHFGGERTAFGTNCNDGKRLNLHYCWSYRKGRKN